MFQKIRSNPRCQFLTIAISIAIVTTVLSLSAYLTDVTDTFSAPLKMMYGTEFGVDIKSTNYKSGQSIVPGGTADFDPYLENSGNYDTYVFMEVTLPDQTFSLAGLSGDWTRLSSVTNKVVYAYGTSSTLTPLTRLAKRDDGSLKGAETSPLCTGVTLSDETDLNEATYTVAATGYAIQAEDIGSSDPNTVWNLISSDMASNSN